jgi:redox-sensitive bicupin YhaK (pirin superfamily)
MIEVKKAKDRFRTQIDWLDSWHSFSFGHHYDPDNQRHGLLMVSNDDWIRGGGAFGTHPHRDMEIVTWVLSGTLEHKDTAGNHGIITPGVAQRMSAGTGISHSEANVDAHEDLHLVQMWVLPDTPGIAPGYEERDINDRLRAGGLVPVASGQSHEGAVTIHQRGAVLWAARLGAGERVEVPEGAHAHVFVAIGTADLDGAGQLAEGDAARLTDAGTPGLTAGPSGAEVLIWVTD